MKEEFTNALPDHSAVERSTDRGDDRQSGGEDDEERVKPDLRRRGIVMAICLAVWACCTAVATFARQAESRRCAMVLGYSAVLWFVVIGVLTSWQIYRNEREGRDDRPSKIESVRAALDAFDDPHDAVEAIRELLR